MESLKFQTASKDTLREGDYYLKIKDSDLRQTAAHLLPYGAIKKNQKEVDFAKIISIDRWEFTCIFPSESGIKHRIPYDNAPGIFKRRTWPTGNNCNFSRHNGRD